MSMGFAAGLSFKDFERLFVAAMADLGIRSQPSKYAELGADLKMRGLVFASFVADDLEEATKVQYSDYILRLIRDDSPRGAKPALDFVFANFANALKPGVVVQDLEQAAVLMRLLNRAASMSAAEDRDNANWWLIAAATSVLVKGDVDEMARGVANERINQCLKKAQEHGAQDIQEISRLLNDWCDSFKQVIMQTELFEPRTDQSLITFLTAIITAIIRHRVVPANVGLESLIATLRVAFFYDQRSFDAVSAILQQIVAETTKTEEQQLALPALLSFPVFTLGEGLPFPKNQEWVMSQIDLINRYSDKVPLNEKVIARLLDPGFIRSFTFDEKGKRRDASVAIFESKYGELPMAVRSKAVAAVKDACRK